MPVPLSLTNPAHITQKDISTLANYNPASGLIAIEYGWGNSRIVTLGREEVTCFQIFLSYFYCGNLVNKQFSLLKITKHLDQFNWSYAKEQDPNSDLHKAYNTLRLLAHKCYGHSFHWEPADVREGKLARYKNAEKV